MKYIDDLYELNKSLAIEAGVNLVGLDSLKNQNDITKLFDLANNMPELDKRYPFWTTVAVQQFLLTGVICVVSQLNSICPETDRIVEIKILDSNNCGYKDVAMEEWSYTNDDIDSEEDLLNKRDNFMWDVKLYCLLEWTDSRITPAEIHHIIKIENLRNYTKEKYLDSITFEKCGKSACIEFGDRFGNRKYCPLSQYVARDLPFVWRVGKEIWPIDSLQFVDGVEEMIASNSIKYEHN